MTDNPKYRWGYGARLRAARAALGASTNDFAQLLNVKRRTVQRIESGDDPMPVGLWADVQTELLTLVTVVDELLATVDGGDPAPVIDQGDRTAVQAAGIVSVVEGPPFTPMFKTDLDAMEGADND